MAIKTRRQEHRTDDMALRLTRVEDLAGASRRELDIQFQRIANMQAELDEIRAKLKMRRPLLGNDGNALARRLSDESRD